MEKPKKKKGATGSPGREDIVRSENRQDVRERQPVVVPLHATVD